MKLTLLHTNDIHGRVDALSRLATQAQRLRSEIEKAGGHCLLVDCGDAEERTVLEMAVTKGCAAAAYLRAAGYDLAAVGNGAALSFGPQVLPAVADTAGFPLLAANLLDESGHLAAGCTASVMREVGGVHIGFLGLAPRFHYWTLFGLQNPETAPIVRAEVANLRAAGATVIVLLSHLGLGADMALLMQVQDIDVVLGGHSHTTIVRGLVQQNTLVAQAGDFGRFLGRVDLEIDDQSGSVVDKRATLIPLDPGAQPSPAVQQAIAAQKALVGEILLRPVGRLTAPLPFDPIGESPAANLLADALRERTSAEVAICQPTHLLAGLPAGTITLGHLFDACTSAGNPAWRLLTGAQLAEMLEMGLDDERAQATASWGRGRPNGRLAASGLTATYELSRPRGHRLSCVEVGGEPLDLKRTYNVVSSDAEMTDMAWLGPDRQPLLSFELAQEEVSLEVPTVMGEVLEDFIARHSPLTPPATGRIRLS